MATLEDTRIGIVGLGYVGLPLAVAFGARFPTRGFDTNSARIADLRAGRDATREVGDDELAAARHIAYTDRIEELTECNVFVITVPTPIDRYKRPDLEPLVSASRAVGTVLAPGDVVIFESTVFPGCTEEVCVPELEGTSGLAFNTDFFVGYSPERINPGDRQHRLTDIVKVTSGSTSETAEFVDALYTAIIGAGTHKTSSIRVAEAAKVIENTQRDINIALVNELALIFNHLGIDSLEVLEAAGTKWNFLPFRPGLVGGHCIGVDPYYLTHKAQEIGYHPEIILAGRRINDGMGAYVAQQLIKLMTQRHIPVADARVLILGLAFKENCPDIRNTRVVDIAHELKEYHARVDVHDPWVDAAEAERECQIVPVDSPRVGYYDAVILAVAHREFCELGLDGLRRYCKPHGVVYDVKSILPADKVDGRL